VTINKFGLANLALTERAPEPIGQGQVRVAIKAVSLNYRDILVARGTYAPDLLLPLIPCSDGAGQVIEVGEGVTDIAPGARVCTHMTPDWIDGPFRSTARATTLGGPADGVLCAERVVPRSAVVAIPDEMTFEEAACLPVAGLTAWSALRSIGGVSEGSRVLVLGTGGVSMFGLQIAKALGCHVAVTSSSDTKLERARAVGADFVVNYRREPWPGKIRDWSGGGVDVVLEVGGDGTFDQSVKATRDGGLVALIGVLASSGHRINLTELLLRRIHVCGVFVGSHSELTELVAFAKRRRISPVIDRTFDELASARHAFAHLATGRHVGKVVIRLAD
jgi:NADPH:quinone reductase-like Zn-dependent oxidoreductase